MEYLRDLSVEAQRRAGRLYIGDISQPRGGPMTAAMLPSDAVHADI
jgi:murein endopeptidase